MKTIVIYDSSIDIIEDLNKLILGGISKNDEHYRYPCISYTRLNYHYILETPQVISIIDDNNEYHRIIIEHSVSLVYINTGKNQNNTPCIIAVDKKNQFIEIEIDYYGFIKTATPPKVYDIQLTNPTTHILQCIFRDSILYVFYMTDEGMYYNVYTSTYRFIHTHKIPIEINDMTIVKDCLLKGVQLHILTNTHICTYDMITKNIIIAKTHSCKNTCFMDTDKNGYFIVDELLDVYEYTLDNENILHSSKVHSFKKEQRAMIKNIYNIDDYRFNGSINVLNFVDCIESDHYKYFLKDIYSFVNQKLAIPSNQNQFVFETGDCMEYYSFKNEDVFYNKNICDKTILLLKTAFTKACNLLKNIYSYDQFFYTPICVHTHQNHLIAWNNLEYIYPESKMEPRRMIFEITNGMYDDGYFVYKHPISQQLHFIPDIPNTVKFIKVDRTKPFCISQYIKNKDRKSSFICMYTASEIGILQM